MPNSKKCWKGGYEEGDKTKRLIIYKTKIKL